jgi:hypothetical protein
MLEELRPKSEHDAAKTKRAAESQSANPTSTKLS